MNKILDDKTWNAIYLYIDIFAYICQGFSTQHCLLPMTEKWRKYLGKDGVVECC